MMSVPAKRSLGFSTIEMMAAVALFSTIVIISVGAMVSLMNANEKSRNLKTAMDNLSFVIDDINRELKSGSKYFCQQSPTTPISYDGDWADGGMRACPYVNSANDGGSYIEFQNKDGTMTFYRTLGACIAKKITPQPWGSWTDDLNTGYSCMTTSSLTISRLRFYVYNSVYDPASGVNTQPQVVVVIQGTAGLKARTQTSFNIMTSITQRIPHYNK